MKRILRFIVYCAILLLIWFQIPLIYSLAAYEFDCFGCHFLGVPPRPNAHPQDQFARQVNGFVPENARLGIAPAREAETLKGIGIRYHLYPFEDNADWEYYLDWNQSLPKIPAGATVRSLGYGAQLIAKDGVNFNNVSPAALPSELFLLTVFLIATFFQIFIGYRLLKYFRVGNHLGWIWHVGTAYTIGFFLSTWVVYIFLVCGGALTRVAVVTLWGLLFFGALLVRGPRKTAGLSLGEPNFLPQAVQVMSWAMVGFFFYLTILEPVEVWDEMTNWVFKAKVLFHHQHIWLTDPWSNYYPITWPVSIANLFTLSGAMADQLAKWVSAAVLLAFITQLYGGFVLLGSRPWKASLGVFLYLFIFHHWAMMTALAENIFLLPLTGMIVAVAVWLKDQKQERFIWLAIFMAYALASVKIEGGMIAVFCALVLALINNKKLFSGGLWLPLMLMALAQMVPFLWLAWLKRQGISFDVYHFSHVALGSNIVAIKDVVLSQFMEFRISLGFFILAVFFGWACLYRKWGNAEVFLFLLAGFLILFSFFSVIFWPAENIQRYYLEVLTRLFMHATPALAFWSWAVMLPEEGAVSED